MSNYLDIEGVLVDADSGEILDLPQGTDKLAWVAARLIDASDQRKAWERAEQALKAVLLKEQADKKAQYGDVVVSVRQTPRKEFAVDAFREWLPEAQLEPAQLFELALCAKGFDPAALNDAHLAEVVDRYTHQTLTRPYVIAERVRKAAPRYVEKPLVPENEEVGLAS